MRAYVKKSSLQMMPLHLLVLFENPQTGVSLGIEKGSASVIEARSRLKPYTAASPTKVAEYSGNSHLYSIARSVLVN